MVKKTTRIWKLKRRYFLECNWSWRRLVR